MQTDFIKTVNNLQFQLYVSSFVFDLETVTRAALGRK